MRTIWLFLLMIGLSVAAPLAQSQTRTTLDIYVVDVEGGNAVLFVTPSGESVLIDTGNVNGGAFHLTPLDVLSFLSRFLPFFSSHSHRQGLRRPLTYAELNPLHLSYNALYAGSSAGDSVTGLGASDKAGPNIHPRTCRTTATKSATP